MKRFKPIPPPPKTQSMSRTRFVNTDIKGLEERFYWARLHYGLGSNSLARQMIEHCLEDLEEQERQKLDVDTPPEPPKTKAKLK